MAVVFQCYILSFFQKLEEHVDIVVDMGAGTAWTVETNFFNESFH